MVFILFVTLPARRHQNDTSAGVDGLVDERVVVEPPKQHFCFSPRFLLFFIQMLNEALWSVICPPKKTEI
jgi:hypothetical protein